MTTVTGDRYLDLLSNFIESNTGPLLDGGLLLKLNPVGLRYLQTRLEALQELEALRVEAPVDYLRAYVADLGDHRALEQVRRVLHELTSVKVAARGPARDPTPVTLLPFYRLRSLELWGCDLSTSSARGLLELRPILEKLVCHNSANALRHIFAERTKEIQDAQVWSRLADVSCFGNGMLLMDESLRLLPAVESLDLSRNRFAKLANLQKCSELKFLDAGFNNIRSVASLNQILHGITKLVLRNNALVSTRGLHRLASLEALDLSYNLISNFCEVELLSELPSLHCLWMEGNPLTFSRLYRKEALSFFSDPIKLLLDGRQTTRVENCAAMKMVAIRRKQRSEYGAFIPAQTCLSSGSSSQLSDSGELEDPNNSRDLVSGAGSSSGPSTLRARKKSSRLAAIQDVTIGLQMASRALELRRDGSLSSQASLDAYPAVQAVAEGKEEVEETVLDLMQRAEALKRTGSSCWLKDLNALLEKEVKNKSQILAHIQRIDCDSDEQNPLLQKRRRKRSSQKGNFSLSNSVSRNSEGSSKKSYELNESDESLARISHDNSVIQMSKEALGRYASASGEDGSYLGGATSSTAVSLNESLQSSFVDGERQRHTLTDLPGDEVDFNLHGVSKAFRLTEELVTGKIVGSSPSSPPQFNQDILHRRQNLERELLQLPQEGDISPLYDSESSSGTIYSHLSDSSESPHHSPSGRSYCFKFRPSFGDAERVKSDSEETSLQSTDSDPAQREALESVGRYTRRTIHPGEDTMPEAGGGQMERSDETLPNESWLKPKPTRRVVDLEPPDLSKGIHEGSEAPGPGEFPVQENI